MEKREPFLLSGRQPDLYQRSSLDPFLIVSELTHRTVAAIKIGISDIVDHSGRTEPIESTELLKHPPLAGLGVQINQVVERVQEASLGGAIEVYQEIQVGALIPLRHVVKAAVIEAV